MSYKQAIKTLLNHFSPSMAEMIEQAIVQEERRRRWLEANQEAKERSYQKL